MQGYISFFQNLTVVFVDKFMLEWPAYLNSSSFCFESLAIFKNIWRHIFSSTPDQLMLSLTYSIQFDRISNSNQACMWDLT